MEFDHDSVRLAVTEDRLSSLPDELIHQILSFMDTKFSVQTCLLSSRWKLLWTSMPRLNLSSWSFDCLPKFAKFVNHVLSHRNHQIEVSSVKLGFTGAASQVFVRKIANYAFFHNVQELTINSCPKRNHEFPSCLFSSQTLKHLTFSASRERPCYTPKTPWDFPALTTLYLHDISLCDDNRGCIDLFSKCVNLKNLTLKRFILVAEVFDIITPQLCTLVLMEGWQVRVINVVAPQLENLTIIDCHMTYLNAPPVLSSFCFRGDFPPRWSKNSLHSLNKVTVSLSFPGSSMPYKEKYARETVNMLQELHSARYLTLNLDTVECISSFPDLLSTYPSPFSNLICLNIDSSMRDSYRVKLCSEARNFLLENSPNATFIMEELPTEAMKAKEDKEKEKARLVADIESHMKELQASLEQDNRKQAKEKAKVVLENLVADLQEWTQEKKIESEFERAQMKEVVVRLMACLGEIEVLFKLEHDDVKAMISKTERVRYFLKRLLKRQRKEMEACYSYQLEEAEKTLFARRDSSFRLDEIIEILRENRSVTDHGVYNSKLLVLTLASQPSSSSTSIPKDRVEFEMPILIGFMKHFMKNL